MPPTVSSVSVLICEKILQEEDGTCSAIRIVDTFLVSLVPDVPVEKQSMDLQILVVVKTTDLAEHSFRLGVIRPDGESRDAGTTVPVVSTTSDPRSPGGFNVVTKLGLVPRQFGTYYLSVVLDDEEVARKPFTLLQQKSEQDG